MKKIVAAILFVCILSTLLASCSLINVNLKNEKGSNTNDLNNSNSDDKKVGLEDLDSYFPEGYTGGIGINPGFETEYYWVETYEECLSAIELLKSHGSTFVEQPQITYEGDLFDVKYCFKMAHGDKSDKIEWGENPFDRKSLDVQVNSFVFFDDVEIEDFLYSLITKYNAHMLYAGDTKIDCEDGECSADHYSYRWSVWEGDVGVYAILHNGEDVFSFQAWGIDGYKLSDEVMDAVISFIEIIR